MSAGLAQRILAGNVPASLKEQQLGNEAGQRNLLHIMIFASDKRVFV